MKHRRNHDGGRPYVLLLILHAQGNGFERNLTRFSLSSQRVKAKGAKSIRHPGSNPIALVRCCQISGTASTAAVPSHSPNLGSTGKHVSQSPNSDRNQRHIFSNPDLFEAQRCLNIHHAVVESQLQLLVVPQSFAGAERSVA